MLCSRTKSDINNHLVAYSYSPRHRYIGKFPGPWWIAES